MIGKLRGMGALGSSAGYGGKSDRDKILPPRFVPLAFYVLVERLADALSTR